MLLFVSITLVVIQLHIDYVEMVYWIDERVEVIYCIIPNNALVARQEFLIKDIQKGLL